ncbi:DUF2953 domain-containing protein [Oribacterium sp. WCC10]|uniref:DUF2953 domain-containing protein n=1 Tax=Oribacterium sp. WCC10 TaxID=1855343 RepID=UPI0008E590F6|nr:DUF2953 domain-containing protein [Oribacterium sp. WCC10]SFG41909.1 hypothetical protein SAMN05216356_10829 [Oribacterium sp. WCC10]
MIVLTILKVIGIVLLVFLLLIFIILGAILLVPIRYQSKSYKKETPEDYRLTFTAGWLFKALRFNALYDPEGFKMSLDFLWLKLIDSNDNENDDISSDSDESYDVSEDDAKTADKKDDSIENNKISTESDGISTIEESKKINRQVSTIVSKQDDNSSQSINQSPANEYNTTKDIMDSGQTVKSKSEGDVSKDSASDTLTESTADIKAESSGDASIKLSTDGLTEYCKNEPDNASGDAASGLSCKESTADTLTEYSKESTVKSSSNPSAEFSNDTSAQASEDTSAETSFSEKINGKFNSLIDKIDRVSKKIKVFKAHINDEENQKAVRLILKDTKYMLKHYRFRKLNGNITYGSDDPASTGSALMYISLLYPLYGENLTIEPVFDRSVLTGDVYFKGHIRLIHLLIALIDMFLNKRIRQVVINHFKEDTDG